MSTIVRSLIALAWLSTAAHAQTPSSSAQPSEVEQARLLQVPPTRTQNYQSGHPTYASPAAVQTVSHSEAVGQEAEFAPMPLRTSTSPQRLAPDSSSRTSGTRATTTVLGSLSVVLAAFFVLVWLSRKTAPKGLAPLPGEVFESLGRAPLTARQQMQLIRLVNKLVLLSVTSTGAEALTEITDVDEVNRLAALCQQGRSGSISDTFR
ncbi:MAG: FliO/MopB family protein, partial [Planctomycetia bacterium]|nr:FliO/MopB family protein [Planctomycetia bacterium]